MCIYCAYYTLFVFRWHLSLCTFWILLPCKKRKKDTKLSSNLMLLFICSGHTNNTYCWKYHEPIRVASHLEKNMYCNRSSLYDYRSSWTLFQLDVQTVICLILQAAHQVGRDTFIKFRWVRQTQVVHDTYKLCQCLGEAWVQGTLFPDRGVAVALVVVCWID